MSSTNGRPGTDHCFATPVGVSDGKKIPDSQMIASSLFKGYKAEHGRVNGDRGDGWCAKEADKNDDWLQVDLGKSFDVCGLATQGDIKGNAWVTDFKLSYLSHGRFFTPYKDGNGKEKVKTDFLFIIMTKINK